MKNEALQWRPFTFLVFTVEQTTEPCAEPEDGEASQKKVESTQDAEQGDISNQTIRNKWGEWQIPFPFLRPLGLQRWESLSEDFFHSKCRAESPLFF